MSWDRVEYDEKAPCVCGKDYVVRHMYTEDDDWNRSRSGCLGMEILCSSCSAKYYIYEEKKHFYCLPWKGDGILNNYYLVPKELSIPQIVTPKRFDFDDFNEEIVSKFSRDTILLSIDDMKNNKFSTRLKLNISHRIVQCYHRRFKTVKLTPIILELEKAVNNYTDYQWNPKTIEDYRNKEKIEIEQSQLKYKETIDQSHKLVFRKG